MSEKNHVVEKQGDVHIDRVEDTIKRMDRENIEEIVASFDGFKMYLDDRIGIAKKIGLNDEQLAIVAEKIANYLAEHVEPKNREEKLLQELWKVGDKEERHMLAHILVKLIDQE